MKQLEFPEAPHNATLREAAAKWMREHPRAMELFRNFASAMVRANRRFSIWQLAQRVRWEFAIGAIDSEEFKVNNNWLAYVARALAAEIPGLADLIECRATPAADLPVKAPHRGQRVDPRTSKACAAGDSL